MIFMKKLFTKMNGKQASIQTPDSTNEEEYVFRCLHAEYKEEKELRTFQTDPAFAKILGPLNAQQYGQAIKAGRAILPRYPDFDLIYKWIGSAYRDTEQFSASRDILSEGVRKAKRKCLLLTDIGETEWKSGNLDEAVYWWSQAFHCPSINDIDDTAYLLMSYVAGGIGLADLEKKLLARYDSFKPSPIRLDSFTFLHLSSLVKNKKTKAIKNTLKALQSKYF